MKGLPLEIGTIHFVGIGGIGMSGIAEVMHNLGYKVQGSDVASNANVKRLADLGIATMIGHRAENVADVAVLVVSTAIKPDNPELMAARTRFLPIVRRAEMLGELMRLKRSITISGTHGKTTTTSMIATLLHAAELDPTIINGGIINAFGTNARLGSGEWMVVEADESDGSFLKLPATIAVVTNIDPEHLDHYGTFDGVRAAFTQFVQNIPFYGFAVLCTDHPEVQALAARVGDCRLVTYGFNPQADVRGLGIAVTPDGQRFDVLLTDRRTGGQRRIEALVLPMHGEHNVQNALAAVAVAREMGIEDDVLRKALRSFGGVKRRFTKTGESHGVSVIDDYGHHPVEIAAVLKAARSVCKSQIVAVMQPHRFSRLQSLFDDFCRCFNDADCVIVADVYAAGEAPIPGVSRDALVDGLRAHGHRGAMALESPEALPGLIHQIAKPGDLVVCLGAGTITNWAYALPGQLDLLSLEQIGEQSREMRA